MYPFRFDLHTHSTCSDGSYTPCELLELAKETQLSGLSITDHDTIAAYTQDTWDRAKKLQIELLTGIEFSARHLGENVHILGYGFSLDITSRKAMDDLIKIHSHRRQERNQAMIAKLSDLGFDISYEELESFAETKVIGRPHIAKLLCKKQIVKSMRDAFNHYLADGKSCYVAGQSVDVVSTIDAIHQAGGVAVIAHPHLIQNTKLIAHLLDMPFDGVECYYSAASPKVEKQWLDKAQTKGMLVTGGSDFHGKMRPHVRLGSSFVDKANYDRLKNACTASS